MLFTSQNDVLIFLPFFQGRVVRSTISNLNTFIEEKLNPQSTFNPGLVLIGFRTTRPQKFCVHFDLETRTICIGSNIHLHPQVNVSVIITAVNRDVPILNLIKFGLQIKWTRCYMPCVMSHQQVRMNSLKCIF